MPQELNSPTESLVEGQAAEKKSQEGNKIYFYFNVSGERYSHYSGDIDQSSEPEQPGQAYMVLELRQQSAIGAFYMPYSSFDCFYGSIQSNQLVVTIVNSYDQTSYPFSIALDRNSQIAGDRERKNGNGIIGILPARPSE